VKPWVLNILACPMCKHHPLDALFFKWETGEDDLKVITEQAGVPSRLLAGNYRHMVGQVLDKTITLEPIRRVKDLTESSSTQLLLEEAVDALGQLAHQEGKPVEEVVVNFGPEVDTLYRYLNLLEVEEGLLACGNCQRWYPIGSAVASIPEMLPDNLREKERELGFLRKWEKKVPKEVAQNGKPFNLGEP
jgi:uncharacterized protein YbaR (Trm112 family)